MPAAGILTLGLVFLLGIGLADFCTPVGVSFTVVYAVGVVFVGWGAGRWPSTVAAAVAAGALLAVEWKVVGHPGWILVLNGVTRFVMLSLAGWLAAEAARLTRRLHSLVEERTAQLAAEVQEHKTTAAQLSQHLEQHQLEARVFQSMREAVLVVDECGSITLSNPAADAMLGYASGELLGKCMGTLSALPPDRFAQELHEALERVRAKGTDTGSYRVCRKDGSRITVETRGSGLTVGGRDLLVVVGQDVTERRRAERTREALLTLATTLNSATTPIEAGRGILASAELIWKWDSAVFYRYFPETDLLEEVLLLDVVDGRRREVPPTAVSGSPGTRARRVLAQGPELVLRSSPDVKTTEFARFGDLTRPSASIMSVPIHREGQAVGLLSIQSYTSNAYSREDLRTLQALADHCGGGPVPDPG